MPCPSSFALVASLVVPLVLVGSARSEAADTAASDVVIIRGGEVVSDDLYAVGVRVIVEGVLEGDLVATAAEDVTITGTVEGDVLAVAPRVEVAGRVDGAVRALGSELVVSGAVGGDIVAAMWRAELGPGSVVEGDVLAWASRLAAGGTVGGTLTGTQRRAELEGEVVGSIDITVGRLLITGPLIGGDDLGYRSAREAEGLDRATVEGVVVRKMPLPPNIRVRALGLLVRMLAVIALTAMALLIAWSWPEPTGRAGDLARARTLRCFGYGATVMLSPIALVLIGWLIAALAPAAAALPLLVVFVPLVLAALGVVLVLSLFAGVPAAVALGRLLGSRLDLYRAALVGALGMGVVWLLPWVGWLIPLVVLPVGLGAWMLALRTGGRPGAVATA